MKRARNEPARPYGGHEYELIRAGPHGSYWRADGVEVRLAAAERDLDMKSGKSGARAGVAPAVRNLIGAVFAR